MLKVISLKVGVTIHRDRKWYVAIDPMTGVVAKAKALTKP